MSRGWKKILLKSLLAVALFACIFIIIKPSKGRHADIILTEKIKLLPPNTQLPSMKSSKRAEPAREQRKTGEHGIHEKVSAIELDKKGLFEAEGEEYGTVVGGKFGNKPHGKAKKGKRQNNESSVDKAITKKPKSEANTQKPKVSTMKPAKPRKTALNNDGTKHNGISIQKSTTTAKTTLKNNVKKTNNVAASSKTLNTLQYKVLSDKEAFSKFVKEKVKENTVYLAMVDFGYVEMAINLWETSFKKFKITNYIFVCLNKKTTRIMNQNGIDCFQWGEIDDGGKVSTFNSISFNQKVMLKTNISRDILLMGYSVIVTDVDIVFLKDPSPYLTCDDCDLIIQDDGISRSLNSGFYKVNPTKGGILMQNVSIDEKHANNPKVHDQQILNEVVTELKSKNLLNLKVLDINQFQPGYLYFGLKRMFTYGKKCKDCVLVHNNYLVGYPQKVYRFKEMLLWMVDTDGYYSNRDAKYLIYNNPGNITHDQEITALETALYLGKKLNRSVILPRFSCPAKVAKSGQSCNALQGLDGTYFRKIPLKSYRESVFLIHPKVPKKIKESKSPIIVIKKANKVGDRMSGRVINIPNELEQSAIPDFIVHDIDVHLHSYSSYSVLRFASLVIE